VASTPWAIKRDNVFWTTTPVILDGFLHFFVPVETGMDTKQDSYKIYNFTLTVTFTESRPMFVFSIFVREFLDESLGRTSFRFPHVLIQILSSELNIFHFIALLLRKK